MLVIYLRYFAQEHNYKKVTKQFFILGFGLFTWSRDIFIYGD